MNTTPNKVTESQMTLEDVDEALKNKELTPEQADLLRFDIRANVYRNRFRAASSKTDGAA